jgi:hypothetical protein
VATSRTPLLALVLPFRLRLTSAAAGAVPVGTWQGRIVPKEQTYTVPSILLTVGSHGPQTQVSGLTGAAHDALRYVGWRGFLTR